MVGGDYIIKLIAMALLVLILILLIPDKAVPIFLVDKGEMASLGNCKSAIKYECTFRLFTSRERPGFIW